MRIAVNRSLARVVIAIILGLVSPASASPAGSPYDVVWASVQVGLGRASKLGGDLGDRSERAACSGGSCSLSPRFAVGGGVGRWGVELHVAATPFTDTHPVVPTNATSLDRHALLVEPNVRFSVLRRWGFDVSVRAGFAFGGIDGDPPTMVFPTNCNAEIPHSCETKTEEADDHAVTGFSTGLSLAWRVRFARGFFGIQADFDVTGVQVAYADGDVYGTLATSTFGIMFGSMIDAP